MRHSLRVMLVLLGTALGTFAQGNAPRREFRPGQWNQIEELPAGRLRSQIQALGPGNRERARQWLRGFHFTPDDLRSLHANRKGSIAYACGFVPAPAPAPTVEAGNVVVAAAAVPVGPFPAALVFHSRPGSANVLYLNFAGETVAHSEWTNDVDRAVIPAVPFSTDGDLTLFSDAEQLAIKRIWQRVAEDFSSFDLDVTTERPATFNNRTLHAVITRRTDANGQSNPYSDSGGVAYVNVFNISSFSDYRPAWIYHDNLANDESFIAEAVSHEVGHNLGLSHDGTMDGSEYYVGHGSGDTSWGPIMGTGYYRNVSQWSKGEYYRANNSQDDLTILGGKLNYRADDIGGTAASAASLVITGGTNVVSRTPETDPTRTHVANRGILERNNDVDVFSFDTGNGAIKLTVAPWTVPSGRTRGGNLDVRLELYNDHGTLLLAQNPTLLTAATVQTNLPEGRYYLHVKNAGAGNPLNAVPDGYTSYGSVGQYFISGFVSATSGSSPPIATAILSLTSSPPACGSVSPATGAYPSGTNLLLVATPQPYYRFSGWTGGVTGITNPLPVQLTTNLTAAALFTEILTTNCPTPHWWLAAQGISNNFESAVTSVGANGYPLWQSYVAGLTPTNPASQLRLTIKPDADRNRFVLGWTTVTGRTYSVWQTTNPAVGFVPLPGATNLPWTVTFFTNQAYAGPHQFFRLEVRKP